MACGSAHRRDSSPAGGGSSSPFLRPGDNRLCAMVMSLERRQLAGRPGYVADERHFPSGIGCSNQPEQRPSDRDQWPSLTPSIATALCRSRRPSKRLSQAALAGSASGLAVARRGADRRRAAAVRCPDGGCARPLRKRLIRRRVATPATGTENPELLSRRGHPVARRRTAGGRSVGHRVSPHQIPMACCV